MFGIYRRVTTCIGIFALVIVSTSGCGRDLYATVRVTGKVLCEGAPATGGPVVFRPLEAPEKTGRPKNNPGQSATGVVNSDGSFSLSLPPIGSRKGRSGALIGPHEVLFRLPRTERRKLEPSLERLPPADFERLKAEIENEPIYAPLSCSRAIWPDTFDVKAGGNIANFVLLPESFVPPMTRKGNRQEFIENHIKIDPSQIDPALLNTLKK